MTPNHPLQRTRRERRGCSRSVPCAGSLSLGRNVRGQCLYAKSFIVTTAHTAKFLAMSYKRTSGVHTIIRSHRATRITESDAMDR